MQKKCNKAVIFYAMTTEDPHTRFCHSLSKIFFQCRGRTACVLVNSAVVHLSRCGALGDYRGIMSFRLAFQGFFLGIVFTIITAVIVVIKVLERVEKKYQIRRARHEYYGGLDFVSDS